jgi:ubiquinone biosynthesis protein COQ9
MQEWPPRPSWRTFDQQALLAALPCVCRYSKRALLTGVYVGAELFMLNDASPGFADTWAALDRGLEGVVEAEGAVEGAGSFASSLGDAAAMALTQLSSMLRRPM